MRIEDFENRAVELIRQAQALSGTATRSDSGSTYVDGGGFAGLRSASLSFFASTFGEDHPYYREFDSKVTIEYAHQVKEAAAILEAARAEVAGGWARKVRGLVSAELFSDFLDMSEHLLDEGYKDAAAVIVGSTLEEHLRQLCIRANIVSLVADRNGRMVPKKADALNVELCKASIYNMLDQKAVTSWLDLRNNAAHGKYSAYTLDQVRLMLHGVLNFAIRNPV